MWEYSNDSLISFMLCFRDIMVSTRHTTESSRVNDKEIRRMIHDEVVTAIREAIPEMFGSIKPR